MENEKVILFADFGTLVALFDSFVGLSDYVACIVDEKNDQKDYNNVPIFNTFDEAFIKFGKNRKMVVSDTKIENIKFIIGYGVEEQYITNFNTWLLETLKTKNIIHKPPYIRFDVCTKCQLNCPGCYMRRFNNCAHGSGYLKFEQFKKFIDDNKFIRSIELSNSGEVFLNPDINKILEYACSKGIYIYLDNGVNFNSISDETIENLVKYHVLIITFSIDGASNETYSKYRVNGNFDRVIKNIKLLNKYKKKYNSDIPYLNWQFILMESDEEDVEKAKKMAEELNMSIYFKKDWSGKFKPKDPKKIYEVTGLSYDDNCYESDFCNPTCIQLLTNPQINWDGRLFGCCENASDDWKHNVLEEDFIECINSDNYRKSIYRLLGDQEVKDHMDPCRNCYEFDNIDKKGRYLYL